MPIAAIKRALPAPVRARLRRTRDAWRQRAAAFRRWLARPGLYSNRTPERVGIVYLVDNHMSVEERLLLYTLVRTLRPARVLELGCQQGASARIITAALEDAGGAGRLVGVDPAPVAEATRRKLHDRFRFVRGVSPAALPEAARAAEGPFDFVHWDAPNVHVQLAHDLEALAPHLAEQAYILVNNPLHFGLDLAVREAIAASDGQLVDCGFLQPVPHPLFDDHAYGGFRLLRHVAAGFDSARDIVRRGYESEGRTAPEFDPELIDHDHWYCRAVSPCPRCARQAPSSVP